jgi:hypothetical protein
MRIACWIRKATNAHSEYVILLLFQCNNGCTNARASDVIVHYLYCELLQQVVYKVATGLYTLDRSKDECFHIVRDEVRTAVEMSAVTPCSFMDRRSVLRGEPLTSVVRLVDLQPEYGDSRSLRNSGAARHLVSEDRNVGGLLQITVLLLPVKRTNFNCS